MGPGFQLGHKEKSRSYPLRESWLTIETIRKERVGCTESDTTEQRTHKEKAKRTSNGRCGPCQERQVATEGWAADLLRQSCLHKPEGSLTGSCRLYSKMLYPRSPHNPVCYNQIYVFMEYLWTINESSGRQQLLQFRTVWGVHMC